MDNERVRVGIVGLGTIGRIHARRLDELGVGFVGADLDPDARGRFEAEFDATTYPDHGAMLESGVDAVIVGVPNRFHEELAVDSLAAGVDVLLEKPLAHSVESAERIVDAARAASGLCTVGLTLRYAGLTRRVCELREAGRFGSIDHVDIEYLRRDFVPDEGRGWFTDECLAGGGVLMDLGVHVIDLALHFLEPPGVVEVSGVTRSGFGSYHVEDSATALLRCADGSSVSVDTSWRATVQPSRTCSIRGTDLGAAFEVSGSDLALISPDGDEEVETVTVQTEDMHLAEDRAFLSAVSGGSGKSLPTVEEALRVQRVIAAIYESSERGRAVTLDPAAEER